MLSFDAEDETESTYPAIPARLSRYAYIALSANFSTFPFRLSPEH